MEVCPSTQFRALSLRHSPLAPSPPLKPYQPHPNHRNAKPDHPNPHSFQLFWFLFWYDGDLGLGNGLTFRTRGEHSRKRVERLNLNHEHQVKWEIPFKNKLIVFFTVAGVLLSYFLVPFFFGFCNAPYGASFFPLALCWFLEPPIAGFITARCFKASTLMKYAIGTVTAIALYFAFFLLLPGATSQTMGLSANFILTKHPEQIQQWAIQVLDRYDAGKLGLTTNVEYWAVGKAKLEDTEIPSQIRDLWWDRPSIGIATITDNGWFTESMRTNIVIISHGSQHGKRRRWRSSALGRNKSAC
jgi:hypothetical protein